MSTCICCCCGKCDTGATDDPSALATNPVSKDDNTISSGFINLPDDVRKKAIAAELMPFAKARPAWEAFCNVCLGIPHISFTFSRTPETGQEVWEAANGIDVGKKIPEAELIHAKLPGWLQGSTRGQWQSLKDMQQSRSLSLQQQAHLLLKLVDADIFQLERGGQEVKKNYAHGLSAAMALVPSLAGLSDIEKYERLASDEKPALGFWQKAIAVAVSMVS